MKLIKNYRVRQMEKYKIKLRRKYKKKFENETKSIRKEFSAETQKVIMRYEETIVEKERRHEKEISIIRQQERNNLEPIIVEREEEIKRLMILINDQKLFYNSLKDREYQLQDVTKNAVNNFERGLRKIEEGFSVVLTAQDTINNYNQKQIKYDLKNQNLIKER